MARTGVNEIPGDPLKDAAHKHAWETGNVVFGIPFLGALAIHLVMPLAVPAGGWRTASLAAGAALLITGITLLWQARRELARFAQPTDPGRPTTTIVASGVFAISRNPMYLGAACFLLGTGLAVNCLWILVFLPASLVACQHVLIAPEERYLARKFGEEYRIYTAHVHRWIGRRSQSSGPESQGS